MQLKKFEYTPILGWSVSRWELFSMCKRQYFYNYYAKFDPENSVDTIKMLKGLTSIPLAKGIIVHDVVKALLERLLKSEDIINKNKFIQYARKKTQEFFTTNKFFEVFYNQKPVVNEEEIFSSVEEALNNFMESDRFEWVTKKAVTNKTDWIIEPEGFGEARLDGMKVYCKVDFLFPVDDQIYILDWKTGKVQEDKHKKQLLGYTTFAHYHLGVDPESIHPIIAYLLPEYKEVAVKVSKEDITASAEQIKKEIEVMHTFCENIEDNIPVYKDKFTKTTNEKICNYCNYQKICIMK